MPNYRIRILLRVSKNWSKFLKASRKLWIHVDLAPLHGKLTRKAIVSSINRAGADLKTLEFRQSPWNDSWEMLLEVCKYCNQLEELNFWAAGIYTQDIARSIARAPALKRLLFKDFRVSALSVKTILESRPSLQHAKFFSVSNCRVRGPPPDTRICLPNLEHLVFCNQSKNTRLCITPELLVGLSIRRSVCLETMLIHT